MRWPVCKGVAPRIAIGTPSAYSREAEGAISKGGASLKADCSPKPPVDSKGITEGLWVMYQGSVVKDITNNTLFRAGSCGLQHEA